ncbi:alkane 1-monooxygenase [Profundibacterium mesophilum]|uniref:Alkane 1-monooxygenase n=1 Tax=Profundibacterium mesophilum KAUST100406-0324 TaxID=1037889 RepID=A0A921NR77_9RHOB|nr:alkane 1-monooxygenase [Profundibacterium mesophilum]KAF0676130.1 alkane 1-monooxygenase [Profundibacterium mesophilum KAUST100406-0324]
MPGQMILHAAAPLLPAALIAVGTQLGGPWIAAALAAMTLGAAILDRQLPAAPAAPPGAAVPSLRWTALPVAIAIAHFALLALVLRALAGHPGTGGAALGGLERAGLLLAMGLWAGQVANADAHELIHRPARGLHRLGAAIYVTLLFGHHCAAHMLVHHPLVGTPDDPATAPRGMSLYRYLPRAWIGGFRAGAAAQTRRLRKRHGAAWWRHHPYLVYVGGAAGCLAASGLAFGWHVLPWYLSLAGLAQSQLLMTDYVQHYGLVRPRGADGRLPPVGAGHSWNAPHRYSAAMLLNAPHHSRHHQSPGLPYGALGIADGAPRLPAPLPMMATLALWPRGWRRLMDRRVAAIRNAAATDGATASPR